MQASAWGDAPFEWLFCENETNTRRLEGSQADGPFKDGINDHVVSGAPSIRRDSGTRVAAHFCLQLQGGETRTVHLRFAPPEAPQINARRLFENRRR